MSLLEAIAYESIAVALMIGITGSLFLEPVAKYGQEEAKAHVFQSFLDNKSLGGLMITDRTSVPMRFQCVHPFASLTTVIR